MSERFDEEQDEELEPEGDAADDQEEEVSEEARAYAERIAQEREKAVRQEIRERLQAQGLDYTGDRAAIRDLNTFASQFGFAAPQPEQPRQAAAATEDPYEALGERPDPAYDEQGARDWDKRYRAIIRQETLAELTPQIDEMRQELAGNNVASATERVQRILTERGFSNVADHPDFAAEFGEALLATKQPMSAWKNEQFLAGVAGFVIPRLKPIQQPERQRDSEGRFLAEANRRSLSQVAAPRETSRPPASEGVQMDATDRRLAAGLGISPEEWAHYKTHNDYESHRQFQERRQQRGRR